VSDYDEIKRYQKRMMDASRTIQGMAIAMGKSKQIIDFDSDMRKNILSKHMAPLIKNGESVAAAEAYARCSETYLADMAEYAKGLDEAHVVRFRWEAENLSFECAQSLLATEREILHKFPE